MGIKPVSEMVAAAKAGIETISPEEARARAEAGTALLVDIRDVRELKREGWVPGSVHAPRGMLEFWVDPASPYHREVFATDKQLVLYCAGAMRSALAAKTLRDMGLTDTAEIDGGFGRWRDDGLPVTTD